ncbi:MAG: C-terminal helicase domain-containing protein, partial [Planctomycetaceae bacterium]|nr:C-terminal helicase domain-containing protein [Planctomycetaceae bacterium]
DRIQQSVLFVQNQSKQDVLHQILAGSEVGQTLVFTKTKRGANKVTEELAAAGIRASVIHGNKSQAARQKALQQFRDDRVRVLVATDVAARGIDVSGITHVINFDVPVEAESYVHRIGRTGRAGADGTAMTLCSNQENRELRAIEKFLGANIPVDPEFPRPEREPGRPRNRSGSGSGSRSRSRFKGKDSSRSSNPRPGTGSMEKSAENGTQRRRVKKKPSRKGGFTRALKG